MKEQSKSLETNPEIERGLQQGFLLFTRKQYDEAEELLAGLEALYPNHADIAALRERVATADGERRREIDRGHWDTIFRIPSQVPLIIGLVLFFLCGFGVARAIPEFRRAGWEGVIETRNRRGHIERYVMRDWMFYNGLGLAAGVCALGFGVYVRYTWDD